MSDDVELAADLRAARPGSCCCRCAQSSGLTGKELGKRGDHDSNELLLAALAEARPDDAVLSEESVDSPARLSADRVWIIDPLDGTREYGMPGRDDWAVHVALWTRGAGHHRCRRRAAVARHRLHHASRGRAPAAPTSRWCSWSATAGRRRSRRRSPTRSARELQPMGSAGAKAMAVLRGDADAYLHAGGQWEWDSAAPVGVVLAAGLHASASTARRWSTTASTRTCPTC